MVYNVALYWLATYRNIIRRCGEHRVASCNACTRLINSLVHAPYYGVSFPGIGLMKFSQTNEQILISQFQAGEFSILNLLLTHDIANGRLFKLRSRMM